MFPEKLLDLLPRTFLCSYVWDHLSSPVYEEVEIGDPPGTAQWGVGGLYQVAYPWVRQQGPVVLPMSPQLFYGLLCIYFAVDIHIFFSHNEEEMSLGLFNGEKKCLTGFSSSILKNVL